MKTAKKITNFLISNNIVPDEDREIYEYGTEQVFFQSLNIITALTIGILTKNILACLLFLVFYTPTRNNAGGYHAKTKKVCFALSTLIITFVAVFTNYIQSYLLILTPILLLCVLIIFKLAPIKMENRPMTEKEELKFRTKTKFFTTVFLVIYFICFSLGIYLISAVILQALVILTCLMILGYLQNKKILI